MHFTGRSLVFLLGLLFPNLSLHAGEENNLLTINPSFEETTSFILQHGESDDVPGWHVNNAAFNVHSLAQEDQAPDGNNVYVLTNAGSIETAPDARVSNVPGKSYLLTFYSKKTRRIEPDVELGVQYFLVFYDAEGNEISAAAGEEAQKGDVTEWEKLSVQTIAPEGAIKVGVRVVVRQGVYPKVDLVDFRFDHFSISEVISAKPPAKGK